LGGIDLTFDGAAAGFWFHVSLLVFSHHLKYPVLFGVQVQVSLSLSSSLSLYTHRLGSVLIAYVVSHHHHHHSYRTYLISFFTLWGVFFLAAAAAEGLGTGLVGYIHFLSLISTIFYSLLLNK